MSARYAVFFCPGDDTGLSRYGNQVLGRTADGTQVGPSTDDYPNRVAFTRYSATPAHYGFHATLKAPFHLAIDEHEEGLLQAVRKIAKQHAPILMQSLQPLALSNFVALCFNEQPEAIGELANQCVELIEPWRAELSPADIQKRNPDQLTDVQRRYLYQYGYPYVMNEFRFHMTLTGAYVPAEDTAYMQWLQTLYLKLLPDPPVLDRLAVFSQQDRQTPFVRIAEFPFGQ